MRHTVVRSGDKKSGGGTPWVLLLLIALGIGTALVIAGRSLLKPYLSKLTSYRAPALAAVRHLRERGEPLRQRAARLLPFVTAVNARRLIPSGAWDRVELRLRRVSFGPLRHVSKHRPQLSVAKARSLIPRRGAARADSRLGRRRVTAVEATPQPAVASLEPVMRAEALPEPVVEFEAAILSAPPSRTTMESPLSVLHERPHVDVSPLPRDEPRSAPPAEELCEIAIWRGYRKSCFYARLDVAARGEDEGSAVAESTPFRYSGNGTLEQTEAAEAAYRALVEELVAQGWEPCESAGPWYAARFSRPLVVWAGR